MYNKFLKFGVLTMLAVATSMGVIRVSFFFSKWMAGSGGWLHLHSDLPFAIVFILLTVGATASLLGLVKHPDGRVRRSVPEREEPIPHSEGGTRMVIESGWTPVLIFSKTTLKIIFVYPAIPMALLTWTIDGYGYFVAAWMVAMATLFVLCARRYD